MKLIIAGDEFSLMFQFNFSGEFTKQLQKVTVSPPVLYGATWLLLVGFLIFYLGGVGGWWWWWWRCGEQFIQICQKSGLVKTEQQ